MRRFRRPARVWILLRSTAFLCAQREPLAGLRRLSDVPIIAPRGNGWEAAGTFNPAVVEHGGKIVMLYRAQDKHGTSRLGMRKALTGFSSRDETSPFSVPKQTTKRTAESKTRGWWDSGTPTT